MRIVFFLQQQIKHVRRGGRLVLTRKVRKLYRIVLMVPVVFVSIPIIVAIRFLRPLVIIRFGKLRGDRIGHFAGNTELYLCERDAGMHECTSHDIFYVDPPACNYQFKKMLKRRLHISPVARYLSAANNWLPGSGRHIVPPLRTDMDFDDLLIRTHVHLSFTPDEELLGKRGLSEMGMPTNAQFISFIGRDSAYLKDRYPDTEWSYHDYRDMDIQHFVPAVEELTRRGYFAIRMGHTVHKPFVIDNQKVIDYATNYRTDFLDIYLCAKCHFFINGMSGLDSVPDMVFRKPMVQINFIPLQVIRAWSPAALLLPKKLWSIREQRLLSFHEILKSEAGRFTVAEQYKKAGIEPIENTPEEIAEVVAEMDDRLKGVWKTSDVDEEMQRRFWSIFKQSNVRNHNVKQAGIFRARIGTKFLRQHQGLLR